MGVNWSERTVEGKFLGFEVLTSQCHYFFGSALVSRDDLVSLFPKYDFRFLRQVHGNDVIPTQEGFPTADGHWTKLKNVALVIQTADCMPVLFGSSKMVIAVHAGWRGVESKILVHAADLANDEKIEIEKILIGPHILAAEFEVGNEVADQLAKAHQLTGSSSKVVLPHEDAAKKRVDLAQIAKDQLSAALENGVPIETARVSTLSSPLFHSFRRGKTKEARQYSFIVLR